MEPQSRQDTCRFCQGYVDNVHGKIQVRHRCTHVPDKVRDVAPSECDACEHYDSRYIQYPIQVTGIENRDPVKVCASSAYAIGTPVVIEPCSEDAKGQFLGILLGEFPIALYNSYDVKTGVLTNSVLPNPAIWVPALGRVVYGAESWWGRIESHDQVSKKLLDDAPVWMTGYLAAYLAERNKEDKDHD